MKLFDRVSINIPEDDESYKHLLSYNGKSGTIIGIDERRIVYILNIDCYSYYYIIQFDDIPDDGNMACVLPESCLKLI